MTQETFNSNLDMHSVFMRYVLNHPEILDQLPSDFRLLILPTDDPALSQRNLELLQTQSDSGKPLVIVRLQARTILDLETYSPEVYVPLAA